MRFAHTNIVSTDWKKLVEFYVTVFNCKIVPPIRNQSGRFLDQGTGLRNAKLQGAPYLLVALAVGSTVYLKQAAFLFMKLIVAPFVLHIQHNEQTASDTDG